MTFVNCQKKYLKIKKKLFKIILKNYKLKKGLQVDRRGTNWEDNIKRYGNKLNDYEEINRTTNR